MAWQAQWVPRAKDLGVYAHRTAQRWLPEGAADRLTPRAAFTLIELVLVVAIIGVLASLGVPQFQKAVEDARVARAIGDIEAIQAELISLDSLPTSLAAINRDSYKDPWDR